MPDSIRYFREASCNACEVLAARTDAFYEECGAIPHEEALSMKRDAEASEAMKDT